MKTTFRRINRSIILVLASVFIWGCESDDNSVANLAVENQFFAFEDGQSYAISNAWVNHEVSEGVFEIVLMNTGSLISADHVNEVSLVFNFSNNLGRLPQFFTTQVDEYTISTNGTIVDGEFEPGIFLLSDVDPQSDEYATTGLVIISNLNPTYIDFSFSFTRNDGQRIYGAYQGNYITNEDVD